MAMSKRSVTHNWSLNSREPTVPRMYQMGRKDHVIMFSSYPVEVPVCAKAKLLLVLETLQSRGLHWLELAMIACILRYFVVHVELHIFLAAEFS